MAIKQWEEAALPKRPGLYINFKEAAAAVVGGKRGRVATVITVPKEVEDSDKLEGKVLRIERESDLREYFGEEATNPVFDNVRNILMGGAQAVFGYAVLAEVKEVEGEDGEVESTETVISLEIDKMVDALDRIDFNVFAQPAIKLDEEDVQKIVAWAKSSANEGKKPFMYVLGAQKDTWEERMTEKSAVQEEGGVFLMTGGSLGKKSYAPYQYASFVAGMIAGTPLNESVTYRQVSLSDVDIRLKNSEIEEGLEAGGLILVHDGDSVRVEQGLTSNGDKIRKVAGRYTIATDLEKTARKNWVGRITNNEPGRLAILGLVEAYLNTLASADVLTDIVVRESTLFESKEDKFFVDIEYTELDSMERIFFTISPN